MLCSFPPFDRSKRRISSWKSARERGSISAARVINHGLSLIPPPETNTMTTAQHLRLGIISRISNDPGRTVYHGCIVGWTMVKRSSSAENVSLRGPQYRRLALRQLAFEMGIDTCIYRVFFLTRPTIYFFHIFSRSLYPRDKG